MGKDFIYRNYSIHFNNQELIVDLFILNLEGFDILIRVDILSEFYALLDFYSKNMTFNLFEGIFFLLVRDKKREVCSLRLEYLSLGFLAHFTSSEYSHSLVVLPIAFNNFLDIFFEELPGLPLVRALEFKIKLVPRTIYILVAPYKIIIELFSI